MVRAIDCRSIGPWFDSGISLLFEERTSLKGLTCVDVHTHNYFWSRRSLLGQVEGASYTLVGGETMRWRRNPIQGIFWRQQCLLPLETTPSYWATQVLPIWYRICTRSRSYKDVTKPTLEIQPPFLYFDRRVGLLERLLVANETWGKQETQGARCRSLRRYQVRASTPEGIPHLVRSNN